MGSDRDPLTRVPLPGRTRWAWLLGTRWRGFRLRRAVAALTTRLPPHSVVADVGAGPGFVTSRLARRAGDRVDRWILLEPQREMWALRGSRRALASRPGFAPQRITADGANAPLRDGAVDAAVSIGVLCCMSESEVPGAVAELVRILKPGGLLLFRVPKRRGPMDEERLRRAGFTVVDHERIGAGLFRKGD